MKSLDNFGIAKKLNQRAVEFYHAAEQLREYGSLTVHVIDYCTALSYELELKSILSVRGELGKDSRHHHILELFKLCKITLTSDKHIELINYYELVLNGIGRYSTTSRPSDRKKLDTAIAGTFKEIKGYFNTPDENSVWETNNESGINDKSYSEIWKILCTTFRTDHDAARKKALQANLTSL